MAKGSVELNPRRVGPNPTARLVVAVLSGAAAMYAVHSYRIPAPQPEPTVAHVTPLPPPPPAQDKIPPAPNSMLLAPEPGGAPPGMLHAAQDDPDPAPQAAAEPAPEAPSEPQPEPPSLPAPPRPRLTPKPFSSGYGPALGAGGIGRGFDKVELRGIAPERAAAAPQAQRAPAEVPRAAPPAPRPQIKTMPRMIEKTPIDPKDILVPSDFHPEDVPAPLFWTNERMLRVGGSGLIALIGSFYLLIASGAFRALKAGRPPQEERI